DVADPGWGSMVGNALDSGGGYTAAPYRGHWEAVCGIEAVLGDGELLRTGMGAMPGSETWQQYRMGIGPCLDGLFRQSSLGVVTKMGFWLFPQPEAYLSGAIDLWRYEDIEPVVDLMNELEYGNVFNGMPSISSPVLSSGMMFNEVPEPEVMNAMVRDTGKAAWRASMAFYGPEEVIRAQWDYVKERFEQFEGARPAAPQFVKLPLSAEDMKKVSKARFGVPSMEIFSVGSQGFGDFNPSDGHIWFSAIIPRTGKGLVEANRVMRRECARLGIPLFMFSPAVTCWTRSFVVFAAVPVYKDKDRNKALRENVREIIRICAEHGWGEYRCPPAFQDAVMDSYSFNNNILRRVNERIKDALDPNGILSAGRYGVWPRHLREERRTRCRLTAFGRIPFRRSWPKGELCGAQDGPSPRPKTCSPAAFSIRFCGTSRRIPARARRSLLQTSNRCRRLRGRRMRTVFRFTRSAPAAIWGMAGRPPSCRAAWWWTPSAGTGCLK